jgi:hypothetical protein
MEESSRPIGRSEQQSTRHIASSTANSSASVQSESKDAYEISLQLDETCNALCTTGSMLDKTGQTRVYKQVRTAAALLLASGQRN